MNLPVLALAVEVLSLTTNNNKLTEFFNRTKMKKIITLCLFSITLTDHYVTY